MFLKALAACAAGAWMMAACAGPQTGAPRLESEARRTVRELAAAYERGAVEDFVALVDQTEFPDFSDFENRVRQFLIANHQVALDVIVDSVVTTGSEASVNAHWNRTFLDPKGNHKVESGSCELVLRSRPSGGLALLFIHGDSPF